MSESEPNPYAPPNADVPPVVAGTGEPLYSEQQVGIATFLGSPIAGFILLARNYARLGQSEQVGKMIGMGLGATVVTFGIAFVLPEDFPGAPLGLIYTFGMYKLAEMWQGTELAQHFSQGRPKASNWSAVGIGLLCLLAVVALIVAMVFAVGDLT